MSQSLNRNARWDVSGGDVPRDLFPNGRIRISLATRDPKLAARRRALCQTLRDAQEWRILHGLAKNLITIAEVERRVAQDGRGAYLNITRDLEASNAGEIPTLAQEISEYCKAYRETRKVRSWQNVKSRLKRLQEQVVEERTIELGRIPIDQITATDIDRALRAISDSPTTQENIRVATSGLFTWSVEKEKVNAGSQNRGRRWVDNPASKVPARDKAIRVRVLTTDEVIRLLRCAEPYQEAYLRSFLHLGLRHGELTHTRLGVDLDVGAWIWEISNDHPPDERCSCAPCRDTGWSTKNKNAPRTIHVPDEPAAIRASIKRYLELSPAQPGDYVFRNPRTGRPWVDRSLHEDFRALCDRAGVPYGEKVKNGVVIHSLRHTCATQLLRSDVEISYVADLLGDKIDTIKKYYLHLNPHDLGSAVRKGPSYDV